MTDDELRGLVRAAVARHLGVRAPVAWQAAASTVLAAGAATFVGHPSHFQYLAVINSSDACVIEPSVGCDHCGYCKSHGH